MGEEGRWGRRAKGGGGQRIWASRGAATSKSSDEHLLHHLHSVDQSRTAQLLEYQGRVEDPRCRLSVGLNAAHKVRLGLAKLREQR